MVRKYSVKSRYYKKSNWSHENKGCLLEFQATATNGLFQGGSIVVAPSTVQGTRTVGNFNITVPVTGAGDNEQFWALVYVPQGEQAKSLFATTGSIEGSLYEPNQYVIASGVSDTQAGPIRIRTRMSRKLHSGDFISLIIGKNSSAQPANGMALVSYSIKYN